MRAQIVSSIYCSLLFYLLVSNVHCSEGCTPDSCGALKNIQYPFYLKGRSPSKCGDSYRNLVGGRLTSGWNRTFELLCVGNKTILDMQPDKYYVNGIWYNNMSIDLVSVNWPNGSCTPPPPSLSYSRVATYSTGGISGLWVSFVKCKERIQIERYLPINCLSRNDTFIYAVYDYQAYQIEYLEPSCTYLAMAPTLRIPVGVPSSEEDLFRLLQNGFTLWWGASRGSVTRYQIFRDCLAYASQALKDQSKSKNIFTILFSPFHSGVKLLGCVEERGAINYKNKPMVYSLRFLKESLLLMTYLIVLVMLGRFVFAPMVIFAFAAYKLHKMWAIVDTVEEFLQNQQSLAPKRYVYSDLIAMTSHFRDKLGQGGFGSVFRGKRPGGNFVAIKMLSEVNSDGEEFINEVSTIGRIHHVNVVRLVGFCAEGSKRALVYEYMPNGSLDKYIFSSNGKGVLLTEDKLNEIALGVARGIDYLHRGCDVRILHFDIKPHNILLDHNMNPKVSDFGLAKFYPRGYSFVSVCAARGTIGYIAPEVISRNFGVISFKSDVYSFGMLLMEMAGGRRNTNQQDTNSSQEYYPSLIYDRLAQEEGTEFQPEEGLHFDDTIKISDVERKLCKVGLWCIQMKPADRPPMNKVVEMLEGDMDTLKMPPKPFFSSQQPRVVRQSFLNSRPSELDTITEDE